MSRAIEPEVAAGARAQSNDESYTQLLQGLKVGLSTVTLEIEFLGKEFSLPAGTYFLVADNSIAIPKKTLVSAFVSARRIFFSLDRTGNSEENGVIMDTSSIMLLMDPEHLTAANARKRVLLKAVKSSGAAAQDLIGLEWTYLDSLLTSPLHRHTKSPVLWSHRKWLAQLCLSYSTLSRPVNLEYELVDIVMKAGEKHPRNYYSWSYIRWLLLKDQHSLASQSDFDLDQRTRDWCLKNPNDISGWSFLFFVLTQPSILSLLGISAEQASLRASQMGKEVLRYTLSFGWKNESVWVFLRTLFATRYIDDGARTAFLASVAAISEESPAQQKQFKAVVTWCTENREHP